MGPVAPLRTALAAGLLFAVAALYDSVWETGALAATPAEARAHVTECARSWAEGVTMLRVTVRDSLRSRASGSFAGLSGDSVLLLLPKNNNAPSRFPVSRISVVEVRVGVDRHTAIGAGIGAALGILAGVLVTNNHATIEEPDLSGLETATGFLVGGVSGMVLGGLIGHSIATDAWDVSCQVPRSDAAPEGN